MELFSAGRPVKGELFYGREKELKEMLILIENMQPIALISQRRMGKTTILKNLEDVLPDEGFIPVYVDCWETNSIEELSETLIENCISSSFRITKEKELYLRTKRFFGGKLSSMIDSVRAVKGSLYDVFQVYIEFKDRRSPFYGMFEPIRLTARQKWKRRHLSSGNYQRLILKLMSRP